MTGAPYVARHGSALRVLLADAIDYAGLFPPAQLDMAGAVAEYASYLPSPDNWALGRFVVPASRLDELATAAVLHHEDAESLGGGRAPWRVSALLGTDVAGDMALVRSFNAASEATPDPWSGRVDTIELRAATPDAVANATHSVGDAFACFVEIPIAADPTPLVRAIASGGARAKVRTGGTTADAFPASRDVVRFLAACLAERVPFKATAGLHHPFRGDYALTYADGSPRATMFGFLNVFLAAAFLRAGESEATACQMIDETSAAAVRFDDAGVTWRGRRLANEQLAASRELAMTSFGSCSFRDPLDDLASLGML